MTIGLKVPKTIRPKNVQYCFELNIRPNFHLVNLEVLIDQVKKYHTCGWVKFFCA